MDIYDLTHDFMDKTRSGRPVMSVRYYPQNMEHRQLLVDLGGIPDDAVDTECYTYRRDGRRNPSCVTALDLLPRTNIKTVWITVCMVNTDEGPTIYPKSLTEEKPSEEPSLLGEEFLGFFPIDVPVPVVPFPEQE